MPRKRSKRFSSPLNAAFLLGIIGVTLALLYGALVATPFVEGPAITLNQPEHTESGTVILSGNTKRVSKVSVNELEIPITDQGSFSVERAYPAGYTVVVITASDRFGRSREETLTFITRENYASEKESDINEESSE